MESPGQKWVVLKLDKSVILHKLSTEFYRSNAASTSSVLSISNKTTNEALEDLFYKEDRDSYLPAKYPTNPQAEVLIKEIILPDYISEISLYTEDESIASKCENKQKVCTINKGLFSYRQDYERWR